MIRKYMAELALIFLGISTITLPWLHQGIYLALISIIYIIFFNFKLGIRGLASGAPLLILMAGWVIAISYNSENYRVLPFLVQYGTLDSLLWQLTSGFEALYRFIVWGIFFAMFGVFSVHLNREQFIKGCKIGLIISATILISQYFNKSDLLMNMTGWWGEQDRIRATFSDPNACGVAAFLLCILSIGTCKFVYSENPEESKNYRQLQNLLNASILSVLLYLGIMSGSRTFILGAGLILVISFWRKLFNISKTRFIFYLIGASSIFLVAFIFLPGSFLRLKGEILNGGLSAIFYSRMIFWEIALKVYASSPILGVGLSNFPKAVWSYRDAGLGTWSDNANSFYLGILAELGIVGFLILGVCLYSSFKIRKSANPIFSNGIIVFLILLLLGPHLDFLEISIIVACLVGYVFEPKTSKIMLKVRVFSLFILPFIVYSAADHEYGLYLREVDIDKNVFQWTGIIAQKKIKCIDNKLNIALMSADPDIFNNPQEISMRVSKTIYKHKLTSNEKSRFEAPCDNEAEVLLKIGPVKPFIPGGQDNRVLGVRIYDQVG